MMRIFIDENIPKITVRSLVEMSYDVKDIRGTALEGISDEDIWKSVQREERLLITTDKGFLQYRNTNHHGILIIRLRQPSRLKIHKRAMQAIKQFTSEEWNGLLIVMRDNIQSVFRTLK